MRHGIAALTVGIAMLAAGAALAAIPPDRDWELCNGTPGTGVSYEAQIAGCTRRIDSGAETSLNLFVAYYNRGFAYYNKGDYDHAIADYGQAIKLKPDEINPFVERGLAY